MSAEGTKQLTEEQVKLLQDFKGQEDGANKFFAKIEEWYAGDQAVLDAIHKCKSMRDSLDFLVSWPSHEKSQTMFYQYMDDLLKLIGYHKA